MDASRLFELDPMAAISYGEYNSVKGEDGSFEDFLLHYDSAGANDSDNSWLTNLITENSGLSALSDNPEMLNYLGSSGVDFTSTLSSSDFLTTKAEAYKLQAMSELSKKGYSDEQIKALEQINNFKDPLLD